MTFISVFIALSACNDDEDLIIADESKKKITVKKLNQKEIKEITPIYEKVVSMNRNIYGRNQDEVYEVSLSNALYITDGTIETYTFPIQTIDSLTKYNLMLSLKNGEYQPYIVHYDLTDEEYTAYLEGNLLDLSEKTTVSILQNNEISITDRYNSNPETNRCFQLFTVSDDCTHTRCQDGHEINGFCGHPYEYLDIHYIPCVTGGGGGGGNYSPGAPSGPGSPGGGGTYSGPSESDGSSVGYTGFVIGDGGTGNQDDVDALNQITQEMDAAFGVGNWVFDESMPDDAPSFDSATEYYNFLINSLNIAYLDETSTEDLGNNSMLKSYRIGIFRNLLGSERGLNVRVKFDLNHNPPDIIGVTTNWFGGELYNEWFYDDNNWSSTINNNHLHIHLIGSLEQGVLINGYGIKIIEHEIHIDFNVDFLGNMVGSPNVELIIQ